MLINFMLGLVLPDFAYAHPAYGLISTSLNRSQKAKLYELSVSKNPGVLD